MQITRVDSNGRRSRAVTHNGTVYLAGQVADDRSVSLAGQTAQALAKVDEMLARCGSDRTKILSSIIWLKSMDDYKSMNEVWDRWVNPDHAPARACVTGDMAYPDILVEIMVVAAA